MMEAIASFLEMGGYAAFVWPAYAVAGAVLGGLAIVSVRSMRRREALLEVLRQARRASVCQRERAA